MKRSVLKSGLAAAIATVMMSCTTAAHAQTTGNTKYIYCQDDTNTTVYTLNEDGKTLTRKPTSTRWWRELMVSSIE